MIDSCADAKIPERTAKPLHQSYQRWGYRECLAPVPRSRHTPCAVTSGYCTAFGYGFDTIIYVNVNGTRRVPTTQKVMQMNMLTAQRRVPITRL